MGPPLKRILPLVRNRKFFGARAQSTAGNNQNSRCPINKRQNSQVAPVSVLTPEIFSTAKPYSEVPGPWPAPIIGNTWRLIPYIGQYDISELAKVSHLLMERYGRIVRMGGLIGRPDLLFVYDADEIERLYRREGPTPFRPSMPCLVRYKSEVRKDFFGDLPGVVGVHGAQWREFRSRVQRPLLQPRVVRRYTAPLAGLADRLIAYAARSRDADGDLPADFDNDIHKWALECIGLVALDVRLGCLEPDGGRETQRIIDAAKFALRNVAVLELKAPYWRYVPTPLWTKYVNNMDFFVDKYINEALERMKTKTTKSEDDLSLLERVLASEKDPKIATIMALDMILVGIDTISMALCSILYQLATRPKEQQKIFEELEKVIPDVDEAVTYNHLEKLNYMKAFVREVFRMYSTVIGNGRTLQEDDIICGYHIPKGNAGKQVVISVTKQRQRLVAGGVTKVHRYNFHTSGAVNIIWFSNKKEVIIKIQVVFPTIVTGCMEQYTPDAATFKPERWLSDNEKPHAFASLPYGHGARICLGRRFADLEIQVLLAKLLRKYKLEYHHAPLDYAVTFMYAPDGPLRLRMLER